MWRTFRTCVSASSQQYELSSPASLKSFHWVSAVVSIGIFGLPTLFADLPPRTLGLAPFLVATAMGMARGFECGLPDGSG